MEAAAILGLGNPGSRYRYTRHNCGFLVLEELARRWQTGFRAGRGPYEFATVSRAQAGADLVLVAPTTYMNGSGEAAVDVLERFALSPAALLVVVDDFNLPLGRLRFRPKGSDGGHNGLASIIGHLGTEAFPRLRMGIGVPDMPPKHLMAEFVLERFGSDEEPAVTDMVLRAADAAQEFVRTGSTVPVNPPEPPPDGGAPSPPVVP